MCQVRDFPYCCTAMVLVDFEDDYSVHNDDERSTYVENEVKSINEHLDYISDDGYAIVTATTTDEQKLAEKALRKCGFKSTRYISKYKHRETRLKLWTKVLGVVK